MDCDYYTDAITYTKVTILDTFASMRMRDAESWIGAGEKPDSSSSIGPRTSRKRSHGEVHVVSRVVGFKKIKFYTNENVGSGELDLPEQQMHTTVLLADDPVGGDGRAAVRLATIGATAWSGWRSRCGTWRSCC